MRKTFRFTYFTIALVLFLSTGACTAGAQTINSAEALKEYLDKQPANSPDKPIKITMNANAPMLEKIAAAINSAGKYVSLNLSGNALTKIPDSAFVLCETLTSITIPDGVTSIEGSAFSGCASLTSVIIPDSVTSIGNSAFWDCSNLDTVTIPNSVRHIGGGAFWGCSKLTTVTIPNSVTNIEEIAFRYCIGLTNITIPDSVTSIGRLAFDGCTSLASVTIPKSVTRIDFNAFDGCKSLTSVTFEGTIPAAYFSNSGWDNRNQFPGDLRTKFYASNETNGTPGRYTRSNGSSNTWTKQ